MKNIDPNAEINSQKWLSSSIDEETKNIIIKMKEDNIEEFNESFQNTKLKNSRFLRKQRKIWSRAAMSMRWMNLLLL